MILDQHISRVDVGMTPQPHRHGLSYLITLNEPARFIIARALIWEHDVINVLSHAYIVTTTMKSR